MNPIDSLLEWSCRPLGKQRQRQLIINTQRESVQVTLRFGERYTITVTRPKLAEAAHFALQVAAIEDEADEVQP
jgi:hypothetical protein